MAALCFTALFEAAGVAAVRFLLPKKSLPDRIWLGLCLGILLEMWLPALCAYAFGFTLPPSPCSSRSSPSPGF